MPPLSLSLEDVDTLIVCPQLVMAAGCLRDVTAAVTARFVQPSQSLGNQSLLSAKDMSTL